MRYGRYIDEGFRSGGGLDFSFLGDDDQTGDPEGDSEVGLFFLAPLIATAVKAAVKPAVDNLVRARRERDAALKAARAAQQAARKAPEGPVGQQAQAQAAAAKAKAAAATAQVQAAKQNVVNQRDLALAKARARLDTASPAPAGSTRAPAAPGLASSGFVVIGNIHQHPGIPSGAYRASVR